MRAVILAGGKGRRLLPYTTIFPKPLMPLGERPIVDIIVRQLVRYGFSDITLATGHLGELVEAYFQNGNKKIGNLKLSYFRETEPLGTAGPLASIPRLTDTFLVMNGDVLTDLDYRLLIDYHHAGKAALTVAVKTMKYDLDFGVLRYRSDGVIFDYLEKPSHEVQVSMGIYVYEPDVLKLILPGECLNFPDLVLRLLEHGQRVVAYETDAFWLDIGRQDDYQKAQLEFAQRKNELYEDSLDLSTHTNRTRA